MWIRLFKFFQSFRRHFLIGVSLFWASPFVLIPSSSWGQGREPVDFFQDGTVNTFDLFRLGRNWRNDHWLFDLNRDASIGSEDLLLLQSNWGRSVLPENRYAEGRATGVHVVIEFEGKTFVSDELEIDIARDTSDSSGQNTVFSLQMSKTHFQPPLARIAKTIPRPFSSGEATYDRFAQTVRNLRQIPHDGAYSYPASVSHRFGHESSQIGTFEGMSFWIGWSGSVSDTFDPGSETFSWIVYFAPEGMFVALQLTQSTYAFVDVYKSMNTFFGAMASPDGETLKRSTISNLLGLSVSYDQGIFDCGPTFFRTRNSSTLSRAIQFNLSNSVEPAAVPSHAPLSVSQDDIPLYFAGFFPIVLWEMDESQQSDPLNSIGLKLQELLNVESDSPNDRLAKEIAQRIIPFTDFLQTDGLAVLKNNRIAESFGDYFIQFSQTDSLPSSLQPNSSIDYLIGEAEAWLQQAEAKDLGREIQDSFIGSLPDSLYLYESTKSIRSAANLCFEMGERYAAVDEGLREDDKRFADTVQILYCTMGEPCRIEVTTEEIAALVPGSNPADFEGVEVIFDAMIPGDEESNVTLQEGVAVYSFYPLSFDTMVFGIRVPPSERTGNLTLELARRIVSVESQTPQNVYFYGTNPVHPGAPMTLNACLVDVYGVPSIRPAVIQFMDYLDRPVSGKILSENGITGLRWYPKPSIPLIESIVTSPIGYTQDEAHTGYVLSGKGFSNDAKAFVNGTAVEDLEGWTWQVTSSEEFLILPPDDGHLLTEESEIRIINPNSISSNAFDFQP